MTWKYVVKQSEVRFHGTVKQSVRCANKTSAKPIDRQTPFHQQSGSFWINWRTEFSILIDTNSKQKYEKQFIFIFMLVKILRSVSLANHEARSSNEFEQYECQ